MIAKVKCTIQNTLEQFATCMQFPRLPLNNRMLLRFDDWYRPEWGFSFGQGHLVFDPDSSRQSESRPNLRLDTVT